MSIYTRSFFSLAMVLGVTLPASAVNVQHMKQRIEKSTAPPGHSIQQLAQKLACKTLQKPICFADGHAQLTRFGLVNIRRPEEEDLFLFFEEEASKKWVLKAVGKRTDLKPGLLITRSEISETTAKQLIEKLNAHP
jgi:hypothetical protein